MHYLRPQYHAPHFARIAHMDMQMIQMIHTRSHCFSRTSPCASQRARRPLGWQHRMALRAAQIVSLGLLESTARDKRSPERPRRDRPPSLLLVAASYAWRHMLLPHVKEEPGTLRPLPQRHRHSHEHLSGSHASPEACKHSLLFSARAAGRANGGKRAHQRVYHSRVVQKRRAPAEPWLSELSELSDTVGGLSDTVGGLSECRSVGAVGHCRTLSDTVGPV